MNWQEYEINKNMPEPERKLYNGRTLDFIKSQVMGWSEAEKTQYIKNAERVIECQVTQTNIHEIPYLKNSNFNIVRNILESNNPPAKP